MEKTVGQKVHKFIDSYRIWLDKEKANFVNNALHDIKTAIDELGIALDKEILISDNLISKEMISCIMKGKTKYHFELHVPEHLQEELDEIKRQIIYVINGYELSYERSKGYEGTRADSGYDDIIILTWVK